MNMKQKTKYLNNLKESLTETLKLTPEASLVIKRGNTIRYSLRHAYPSLFNSLDKEVLLNLIHDVIYLDRQLRLQTVGKDRGNKEKFAKRKIIELGYRG